MKQAFIYCLKVYITGTLLAILLSGLVCYNLHRETFSSFGVSYNLLFEQFASLWERILLGSIVIWLVIVKLVQMISNKDWTAFKKRRAIFVAVEGLTAVLLAAVALVTKGSGVVPWILVWLICAAAFAMSVMIYGPKPGDENISWRSKQ